MICDTKRIIITVRTTGIPAARPASASRLRYEISVGAPGRDGRAKATNTATPAVTTPYTASPVCQSVSAATPRNEGASIPGPNAIAPITSPVRTTRVVGSDHARATAASVAASTIPAAVPVISLIGSRTAKSSTTLEMIDVAATATRASTSTRRMAICPINGAKASAEAMPPR